MSNVHQEFSFFLIIKAVVNKKLKRSFRPSFAPHRQGLGWSRSDADPKAGVSFQDSGGDRHCRVVLVILTVDCLSRFRIALGYLVLHWFLATVVSNVWVGAYENNDDKNWDKKYQIIIVASKVFLAVHAITWLFQCHW